MSSLAQEESRSISENVTWGQRKQFSDGKVSLPYKQFLGYERGENKNDPPVVNPEQAVVVRRIYRTFMEGRTAGFIAKELTEEGVPTPAGKTKWQASTISSILQNEKYRGSALLQKCFTTDFLTKKQKVNEGEVPQYYIEHSHEAIIDPLEWDAVQDEIRRRKEIGRAYSGKSVFSAKIVCGECGAWYGHKTWHSNDKYRLSDISVCDEPISAEAEAKIAETEKFSTDVFGMYIGQREKVTLEFTDEAFEYIFDKFGEKQKIKKSEVIDGVQIYSTEVDVEISPPFWGWICTFAGKLRIAGPDWVNTEFNKWKKNENKIVTE